MKSAEEIYQIWLNSKLKRNLEKNYLKSHPGYEDQREERLSDLIELLSVFCLMEKAHPELYKNKLGSFDTYHKYIYKEIVCNYPFKCFKSADESEFTEKQPVFKTNWPKNLKEEIKKDWKNWIIDVFKAGEKRSVTSAALKPVSVYENDIDTLIRFRKERLSDLAIIVNTVTDIYKRAVANGEYNIYGNKLGLAAFIGQHVIRMFPFKDTPFVSLSHYKNPKGKKVYEHYTPLSFFAKLIGLKEVVNDLTEDLWKQLLFSHYRIVIITKEEDDCLNKENKTKRTADAYRKCGIIIHDPKQIWHKLHDLKSYQ